MTKSTNKSKKIHVGSITDRIAAEIQQSIIEGEFQDNQQFPSLIEMAKQYDVSVATMREALRKLEALNYVQIKHGKGVFVRRSETRLHWQAKFTSFSETIRSRGKLPGAKLLHQDIIPASQFVASQLNIGKGTLVYFLKRLRYIDNEPIAIEESFLPYERFPSLFELYKDPMSLYQLLQNEYEVRFIAGIQTLEAINLNIEDSKLLETQPGSPALNVNTIAYDFYDVPAEFGSSLFRGDKYRYVVRLSR
ncbi:MAG: GntR family transcriptional regulator [Candidatus Atribacteria bacterium]|nr:GntR family transcriptional regulator [Candidatus Atribacteria bacterium]